MPGHASRLPNTTEAAVLCRLKLAWKIGSSAPLLSQHG